MLLFTGTRFKKCWMIWESQPNYSRMMPLVIRNSIGVRGRAGKIFWVTIAVKARSNSAIARAIGKASPA
jgi:hypothetical protein